MEALNATGDTVTEALNRILASVCQGDLSLIKQLIEDSKLNEFVQLHHCRVGGGAPKR